MSEAIRSRLGHLLADAGGATHGVAVLAFAPGERHKLGLMMTTIALRRDGWKVVYLGADAPLEDALALSGSLGACARAEHRGAGTKRRSRSRFARGCAEGVSVVVGGAGASGDSPARLGALHAGPTLGGAVQAIRALAT